MYRLKGSDTSKGPLLLLPDYAHDSLAWLEKCEDTVDRDCSGRDTIGTRLALDGWDVWFANPRGTRNSPTSNWDYEQTRQVANDLPAMLERIKLADGQCRKTSIMGHGQGANQALIALAYAGSNAAKYISQALVLAPCLIPDAAYFGEGELD